MRGRTGFYIVLSVIGLLLPVPAGALSVGEARLLPDSTQVILDGKVVTAIVDSNTLYIQESDRGAGVRVSAPTSGLAVGDIVNVTGAISTRKTDNIHLGERVVTGTASHRSAGAPPKPLTVPCSSVGGAAIAPWVPGVHNGVGLNNFGLLAKVIGKVTYVATSYWYVDDGSNVDNIYSSSTPVHGVLVKYPTSPVPVSNGDVVGAVGIIGSSIANLWGTNRPYLQLRDYADFQLYWSGAGTTGTISGTVKDSLGALLAGATVATDRGGYSTTSGGDGRYNLSNVAAGTYSVTAFKSGYNSQSIANLTFRAGQTAVADPVLTPTPGTITGVVKDSVGSPLAGATVSTDTGGYLANSDSSGAYTLAAVAPGSYSVTAFKGGYAYQTVGSQVLAPGGTMNASFALSAVYISPFLFNGDFERGFTSGVANGWSVWHGAWSNTITYSAESTAQLAGASAQRWGRSDARKLHGGLCASLPTIPGVTYEVAAWLRMDVAESTSWLEAGVDLTGQTVNGEAASVNYTKLETSGNRKWIRYRAIIKATGSSISFFTKLGHDSESAGPNWAYVDNVSIQPYVVLEAEDYTNANDTTPGNSGNIYRTGDVDIVRMPGGVGYAVGWTDNGEWLEWTNQTTVASDYVAIVNYAGYSDSIVHLNVDGVNVTGSLTLPKSGGWDAYRRAVAPAVFSMTGGSHTPRLTIDERGCNLDSVELVPLSSGIVLQAEDYTAYYDINPTNSGKVYRNDGVDIGLGSEGYYVGWTGAGEWLDYALQGDGRTYVGVIRYACGVNGSVNLQTNGSNLTGTVALPSTGGSSVWKSVVTPPFTPSTGASTLRLYVEGGGFSVNYIALVPVGDGGGGSDLLTGVHFAGDPNQANGINDMASQRGSGQWLYSTEVYANGNREPDDPSFIQNMTDWIVGYLKPIYQAKIHPIVRIDYIWGETVPRLLSDGSVDAAAISRYARTFKKFAQLADANGVPIRTFVVANEMNLKGEATGFTNGYIPEWYYAQVYDAVRTQVNALGPGYEVLVGGMSPGSFTVDPIYTPPTAEQLYSALSTDALVYIENVVREIKRRGTQNVGFSLHGYANFDGNDDYTNDFMWTIRKQLEIIEREHTVTPYGQQNPVAIPGYRNAPVYITEWNRHTPQNSADGRVFQETLTANFIRNAVNQIARFNCNREVWDNVARVWRSYDHRSIQHNFHPIKGMTYFVFDSFGSWGDYSLKDWHTLSGSAEGVNDMYNAYQSMIGRRDASGH